jgi:hypothetical protein
MKPFSYWGKGKLYLRTGDKCPEGEVKYSSTLSLISTLDKGGWSTPRSARFAPKKGTSYPLDKGGWSTRRSARFAPKKGTRYPLYWRLHRPQARSGRVQKILPAPRFEPRTFQPVVSYWGLTNFGRRRVKFCRQRRPGARNLCTPVTRLCTLKRIVSQEPPKTICREVQIFSEAIKFCLKIYEKYQ